MQKSTINLQDTFLAKARRAGTLVTVFLMNGFQIHGVIGGYDSFVVILDSVSAADLKDYRANSR